MRNCAKNDKEVLSALYMQFYDNNSIIHYGYNIWQNNEILGLWRSKCMYLWVLGEKCPKCLIYRHYERFMSILDFHRIWKVTDYTGNQGQYRHLFFRKNRYKSGFGSVNTHISIWQQKKTHFRKSLFRGYGWGYPCISECALPQIPPPQKINTRHPPFTP